MGGTSPPVAQPGLRAPSPPRPPQGPELRHGGAAAGNPAGPHGATSCSCSLLPPDSLAEAGPHPSWTGERTASLCFRRGREHKAGSPHCPQGPAPGCPGPPGEPGLEAGVRAQHVGARTAGEDGGSVPGAGPGGRRKSGVGELYFAPWLRFRGLDSRVGGRSGAQTRLPPVTVPTGSATTSVAGHGPGRSLRSGLAGAMHPTSPHTDAPGGDVPSDASDEPQHRGPGPPGWRPPQSPAPWAAHITGGGGTRAPVNAAGPCWSLEVPFRPRDYVTHRRTVLTLRMG